MRAQTPLVLNMSQMDRLVKEKMKLKQHIEDIDVKIKQKQQKELNEMEAKEYKAIKASKKNKTGDSGDEGTGNTGRDWFVEKRATYMKKINITPPGQEFMTHEVLELCKGKWIQYVLAKAWERYDKAWEAYGVFEVDIQNDIMVPENSYGMLVYFEQMLGKAKTRNLICKTISKLVLEFDEACLLQVSHAINWELSFQEGLPDETCGFCNQVNVFLHERFGQMQLYGILRGSRECLVIFETNKVLQDFITYMGTNHKWLKRKFKEIGFRTLSATQPYEGKTLICGSTNREDACDFLGATGYKPGSGQMLRRDYRWFVENALW